MRSSNLDFATNPHDLNALDDQAAWLTQAGEQGWLLVDTALIDFDRVQAIAFGYGAEVFNTLSDSSLSVYRSKAPHLLQLPPVRHATQALLEELGDIDRLAPAMSWFCSVSSAQALCADLAWLAQAVVEDDVKVYARFADTRVLPDLLQSMSVSQRARIARHMAEWRYFNRSGHVCSVQLADTPAPDLAVMTQTGILIDRVQTDRLIAAAEADSMFALLLSNTPELVPADDRAAFHARLAEDLERASAYKMTVARDRFQFLVLSLSCGRDFDKSRSLNDTWTHVANGASLTDLMQGWPEHTWADLELAGGTHRLASAKV
jgi:hypothetical protein